MDGITSSFACWGYCNMYFVVLLGRIRKHGRRKWKFIQMAAEVDLSLPVDRCGMGVCDLMSGRSEICGGMASVFTSARRTDRGRVVLQTYKTAICYSVTAGKSTIKLGQLIKRVRCDNVGPFHYQHFS